MLFRAAEIRSFGFDIKAAHSAVDEKVQRLNKISCKYLGRQKCLNSVTDYRICGTLHIRELLCCSSRLEGLPQSLQ
jgi:hypothetical protein